MSRWRRLFMETILFFKFRKAIEVTFLSFFIRMIKIRDSFVANNYKCLTATNFYISDRSLRNDALSTSIEL